MQTIHDLLMSMTAMLFALAGMVVLLDLWHELEYRRSVARGVSTESHTPSHWRVSLGLALAAWIPLIVALCMVLFTSGRVGIRLTELDSSQVQSVAVEQGQVADAGR